MSITLPAARRLIMLVASGVLLVPATLQAAEPGTTAWLKSTAYAIPRETTNQGSGYFSLIEGQSGRLYIGTAKYGVNAFLVEFDPATGQMPVVVDAQKEIGTNATGFAAQSKFHTRNNVGASGKIYIGTKQGYPSKNERWIAYPGGYPMVYDPKTNTTRVYPIPIPHQGISDIQPDEARGVAYISTCSDGRPVPSGHFIILDLETGTYRDLLDCKTTYAFIMVDSLGRAYHPIKGGEIARYDPETKQLDRLKQTIDGQPLPAESLLTRDVLNWDISPDHKTLYCVPMTENQLYSYDLTAKGDTLPGRRVCKIFPDGKKTDCRAMCVGPKGEVWAGGAVNGQDHLHVVSYRPGDTAPRDHGPLAVRNPVEAQIMDKEGKLLAGTGGYYKARDGSIAPRYHIMAICQARDGKVYVTTLAPFTLHQITPQPE